MNGKRMKFSLVLHNRLFVLENFPPQREGEEFCAHFLRNLICMQNIFGGGIFIAKSEFKQWKE